MDILAAPQGLVADLITPIRSDASIDGHGLARLLERVSPNAQALLLASPHTGEGKNLGLDQRVELLEKSLVVIRGRIPIFAWISQDTEEKTKKTLLAMKKVLEKRKYIGQVFWADTPLYFHSNRGLPAYYESICSLVDNPIILYNDTKLIEGLEKPFKRNNIRTAILKELTFLKNIVGLIFLGSIDRAHDYHRACRRRPNFRIYDGDEAHFLQHPSMSGTVSIGASLAPIAWQKITQSSLQLTDDKKKYPNYLQQVWESGYYLRNLKDIYHRMPVAIVKEILSDIGIIETPLCTFPTKDVEESKRQAIELMVHHGDYPQKR